MIPLEKQCVSLEFAKRLKELGVNQESLFYWMDDGCGPITLRDMAWNNGLSLHRRRTGGDVAGQSYSNF